MSDPLLPVVVRAQVTAVDLLRRLPERARDPRGQGTVEYVALVLLIAAVFAAVVKAYSGDDGGIAKVVVNKVKGAIDGVKGR